MQHPLSSNHVPSDTQSLGCQQAAPVGHGHHGGSRGHSAATLPSLATAATLHCLTGCALGEFAGLALGVTFGFTPGLTMALATVLAFISGYTVGLLPLVKQGLTWRTAFQTLWLGETVSIAVMELAMNVTDYQIGGVQATSLLEPRFWIGYLVALPAGFIAAWPVNYWLLTHRFKTPCHG